MVSITSPAGSIAAAHAIMAPLYEFSMPNPSTTVAWTDNGSSDTVVAYMDIRANVPTVSFDNIPGLKQVACDSNTVSASFESTEPIKSWSNERTLLVIASRHLCGKNGEREIGYKLATSWSIKDNSVTFQTVDPESAGVTGDIHLVATPIAEGRMQESDVAAESNDQGTVSPITSFSGIKKSIPLSIHKLYDFERDFSILKGGSPVKVACKQCGFVSDTVLTIDLTGNLFKGKYNINLVLEGNADLVAPLAIGASAKNVETVKDLKVFEYKLKPLNIAGLLKASPVISIHGSVDEASIIDGDFDVSFKGGFDKFRAEVSSDGSKKLDGFNPTYSAVATASIKENSNVNVVLTPTVEVGLVADGEDLGVARFAINGKVDVSLDAHGEDGFGKVLGITKGACVKVNGQANALVDFMAVHKVLAESPKKEIFSKCF